MIPAAAIKCPNDHLNAVAGGALSPKTRRIAAASDASDCGVPLPCAAIISGTFAEEAAVAARIERPDRILRQQPHVVIIEDHLRLDGRIVADRERAVRLARAQSFTRLDHRQRAADAVVGDTGVSALEAVADADVAKNVIGQRAQQPHRIEICPVRP